MRRSVCYAEPSIALAGERKTWRFIITPSANLPKGTKLKFDLSCKGRYIDWEIPQINQKDKSNLIWAEIEGGKTIYPKIVKGKGAIVPDFEFTLPASVASGKKITIAMGTPLKGKQEQNGNLSQLTIQRRRPFYVHIDTSGKGKYTVSDTFYLDVRGNKLENIRILAPSLTVRNRRFDVMLRFEDEYGNLTGTTNEETMVEFSHENLRESLNWKLFLPETGFIALPNLYFNEPGVYNLRVKNLSTDEEFLSAPIKCFQIESKNLFWGTLHGESERFDSTENIENCLRHFRDEESLNFFSSSTPDSSDETPNDMWRKISQSTAEFDEEDRFCAFLGEQWCGTPKSEGLRIFVFNKPDRPIIRQTESRFSSLKKVYKMFSPKEFISIPSFSMSSSVGYDFEDFAPEFERVAEIYNAWGCSERTKKEGNPFPITSPNKKKGVKEFVEGALLGALKKNRRVGFVSGGLDDRNVFSPLYDIDQQQYHPGLTAVLCDRLTRQNVFDALYNRHCYATTGKRIVVGFSIAGHIMGSELTTATKPGLQVNRFIEGYVAGTTTLKSVEIIRNGEVLHTYKPNESSLEFEYDDLVDLQSVSIKDPATNGIFAFYYLRVTQKDGHMAWSSPIWIDCLPRAGKKSITKPAPKSKPSGKKG
jgi:hypothetical protein